MIVRGDCGTGQRKAKKGKKEAREFHNEFIIRTWLKPRRFAVGL
jgi:hypothetical protein